jgi:PIN domain nuclease of toxin-antitoxin system
VERGTVILLDTHALIWLGVEPKRLSKAADSAIREALDDDGIAIASISLWEIAMLVSLGRLTVHGSAESWIRELLERSGAIVKEITPTIATLATQFSSTFPADPADRLIAATARAERMALVSRDAKIRASRLVRTVW